jgi:hypothetical protein
MIFFKRFKDFILAQPLNEMCYNKIIKINQCYQAKKIKMAAFYVKNKNCFRRHLGPL